MPFFAIDLTPLSMEAGSQKFWDGLVIPRREQHLRRLEYTRERQTKRVPRLAPKCEVDPIPGEPVRIESGRSTKWVKAISRRSENPYSMVIICQNSSSSGRNPTESELEQQWQNSDKVRSPAAVAEFPQRWKLEVRR